MFMYFHIFVFTNHNCFFKKISNTEDKHMNIDPLPIYQSSAVTDALKLCSEINSWLEHNSA